jgi:hypothetical protein
MQLPIARHNNVRQHKQPNAVPRLSLAPRKCCGSSKSFLGGTSSLAGDLSNAQKENRKSASRRAAVQCGVLDFVGRDLLRFDTGKWYDDVEEHGAMAMYMPLEGGPEGRYVLKLKREGYHILNLTARGLGDPEAYLMKVHGVRPVSQNQVLCADALGLQLHPNCTPESVIRWLSYFSPPQLLCRMQHCAGFISLSASQFSF